VTGGALLAHTIAGLLDSHREITRPQTLFAPLTPNETGGHSLSRFYQQQVKGRTVLLVDDIRNTGQTLARCAATLRESGANVIASAEIYDRLEAMVELDVPNVALAEYKAPENFLAASCPLCASGVSVTTF